MPKLLNMKDFAHWKLASHCTHEVAIPVNCGIPLKNQIEDDRLPVDRSTETFKIVSVGGDTITWVLRRTRLLHIACDVTMAWNSQLKLDCVGIWSITWNVNRWFFCPLLLWSLFCFYIFCRPAISQVRACHLCCMWMRSSALPTLVRWRQRMCCHVLLMWHSPSFSLFPPNLESA